MRAVTVDRFHPEDPAAGVVIRDVPDRAPEPGWIRVAVECAALNHHDVWSLRGVGLGEDALPMVLGTDATGTLEDGTPVLVHGVINDPAWRGDDTLDPRRSLLSERYPGTLAEAVWVPPGNVVPRHPDLSSQHAACLPTSYLTAYRLLFTAAQARPGQTVLVQGAGGGVATACVLLGRAAGLRVWVTSRSEEGRRRALELGAHDAFETGARLPRQVDAVIETVGKATWGHSLRSLLPGGVVAVAGSTTGPDADAELNRVFFRSIRVVGATMGTREELALLQEMLLATGVRPLLDRVVPLEEAPAALGDMARGAVYGKMVLEIA